jgi:hypothetical protein
MKLFIVNPDTTSRLGDCAPPLPETCVGWPAPLAWR